LIIGRAIAVVVDAVTAFDAWLDVADANHVAANAG